MNKAEVCATGQRLSVILLAVVVVLPTTLVSIFFTSLFASATMIGAFKDSQAPFPPQLLAACVVAGWLGIVALWRLCLHFRSSPALPRRWQWDAAGLVLGTAAALTLIIGLGVEHGMLLLFFLWPVIAAIALGALLFRAWRRSGRRSGDANAPAVR